MTLADTAISGLKLAPKETVLMVDDCAIADAIGVTRELGCAQQVYDVPVFKAQEPWEGRCVTLWGSVLWDSRDARFKMWYIALHPDRSKANGMTLLCYAYSYDGINWHRPSLGLQSWDGCKNNNILMGVDIQLDTPTVYLNPFSQTENDRFVMLLHHRKMEGFCLYESADGIHWNAQGRVALNAKVGDRHTLMLDPISQEWRIYHKIDGRARTIWLATSKDLKHWDEHGEVLAPNANDPPETEFYGLHGFTCQGYRLGYLEVFDVLQRRLRTELVTLDERGIPNRFEPAHTFLDTGQWGQWHYAWAFPSHNAPIRVGEELWIYFHGRQTLHWAMPPWGDGHVGAIGLAKLRAAGFACMAAKKHGVITTHPLVLRDQFLCINADAAGGELRCELIDESGRALPGFTAEDFYPLRDNATYYKCNWAGVSQLSQLRSRSIRIRIYLDNAKLYSFWLTNNPRV